VRHDDSACGTSDPRLRYLTQHVEIDLRVDRGRQSVWQDDLQRSKTECAPFQKQGQNKLSYVFTGAPLSAHVLREENASTNAKRPGHSFLGLFSLTGTL
jgi:hypothetical protein